MKLRSAWGFIREVYSKYSRDKVPKLSAALSYLTVFSLAPLLLIIVGVAGLVFGSEAAQERVVHEIAGLVGPQGARLAQQLIENSWKSRSGVAPTVVGFIMLLLASTGAFSELQDSLNIIWGVKAQNRRSAIRQYIRQRLMTFGLVLAAGFLMLVSLVFSTAISAMGDWIRAHSGIPVLALEAVSLVLSLGLAFLLFLAMYKMLPDVSLSWHDVRTGAAVTAVLFVAGKSLISMYLGHSATASAFGAAGSLAVLLIWIYYSAQIFFVGAEFTSVLAGRHRAKQHAQQAPNPFEPPAEQRYAAGG